MISNYYTLAALASELHSATAGRTLGQPYTQRKHELVVPFGDAGRAFVVSCEPSQNFLLMRDSTTRAQRNATDIFPPISGRRVERVRIAPSDRRITVQLHGTRHLVLELFGSRANVFLAGDDGTVEASFLKRQHDASLIDMSGPADDVHRDLPDMARRDPAVSTRMLVKRTRPMFGPLLVQEALFRAGSDPDQEAGTLSDAAWRALEAVCVQIEREALRSPVPRIYDDGDGPVLFSLVSLTHLGDVHEEIQPGISDGILRFLSISKRRSAVRDKKEAIVGALMDRSAQATAALAKLHDGPLDAGEAERLDRFGRLLQANLHAVTKGMPEVEVDDFLDPAAGRVALPLDPHLTPARNAERYFARARKARTRTEEHARRAATLQGELTETETLLAAADEISTEQDAMAFAATLPAHVASVLPKQLFRSAVREAERPPFRVFTVDGGFQVWVGRNSENNDLLSTRHTAKDDLWFHARGAGGSHTVLKRRSARGDVPRSAIQQAAAIAAYYSKMRKASHVPVSMCEGKYVRKPKGAPSGTVRIEREEVLFADPALPAQEQD